MKSITYLFNYPFIEALGWTLIHSVWQIAVWAILALSMLTITHRKMAHIRYTILALVMVGICTTSVLTFSKHYNVNSNYLVAEQGVDVTMTTEFKVTTSQPIPETIGVTPPVFQNKILGLKNWFISYFTKHLPAIVTMWFLGFVFLLLKYIGGISWMMRLRSLAQPIEDKVQNLIFTLSLKLNIRKLVVGASSNKITTPVVIGHLKPIILFPVSVITGLTDEELESIILHELAHIKRNDYLVNLIQSFLETVFFFHPGIWWLSSAIRTEREHACDDLAVKGGANEVSMAKSLAQMAALSIVKPNYAVAFSGKQHKLKHRINRLIKNETMKTNFKQKVIVALAIIVTACTLSFRANADSDRHKPAETEFVKPIENGASLEKKKKEYYAINPPSETTKQKPDKSSEVVVEPASAETEVLAQSSDRIDNVLLAENNIELSENKVKDKQKADSPLNDKPIIKKNRWGVSPTMVKTFAMLGSGNLEVHTSGGSIEVVGNNGSEVQVQAFVKINGRLLSSDDSRLDDLSDGYELIIEKNGNTVIASAKKIGYGSFWRRTSVSFIVFTPHEMAGALKTSGGSISIAKLVGNQALKTSGGSISIDDISGDVSANTSGGSIKVSNQEGNMSLRTSGGSIKVHEAKGNVVGNTSGGSIHLENIFGNAQVHTSGGGIRINGHAESIKASTSGGSIHADIDGLNKLLDLSTSGGGIHANIPKGLGMDLDLKGNSVNIALENFTGTSKKNYINGTMNGGGIPVVLRTSGGGVTVDFN